MFSFAAPWMGLFLFLPILIWWLLPTYNRDAADDAPEIFFPNLDSLRRAFQQRQKGKRESRRGYYGLLALLWLFLIAALMQPQLVDHYTKIRNKGYDLMLAVDLSGSMNALDYTIGDNRASRLNVVKSVVSQFVAHRQGDRVGLVLFGTKAYLHVPLTLDTLSVRKMLDNTVVGEAGDATAIGDAIGLAVRNLRGRPENSRVIILLTDGGDNASTIPPLQAAKLAQQYGIRVYTIAIGTNGPVPIADDSGNIVMARFDIDEDLLKKIADTTGGTFFHATDTEALQNIYNQIDRLEKTESDAKSYMIRTPLFRYPLGAALLLLTVLSCIPLYRRIQHVA
jgi:Ca-activated chloride channel family protein